jgi:glutamate synthase domain-containing protein 3
LHFCHLNLFRASSFGFRILKMRIDARGLDHRELNERIRGAIGAGCEVIQLDHVNGQRYIGAGLRSKTKIIINGVPGNDLAAFMDGPEMIVNANAQDGVGNTMNSGKIVIHGDARDIIGYSMRGGKIFVRGSVGYRVGIHMKSFKDQVPVLVIGGRAKDFLGEYMAGGIVVLLGLNLSEASASVTSASPKVALRNQGSDHGGSAAQPAPSRTSVGVACVPRPVATISIAGHSVGTGMHGGCIYVRGRIPEENLGKEVKAFPLTSEDKATLGPIVQEFAAAFGLDVERIIRSAGREPYDSFTKLIPVSHRPYGRLYAY